MRLLLASWLFFYSALAGAAGLDMLRIFLQQTTTGKARFAQIIVDKNLKQLQQGSGTMHFLRPGKFRWEYEKDPGNSYCRHHFQGPITVPIKHDTEVSLNDLHVPTGFVTVEEILRFCIVDLGVPPLSPATLPPAPAEPGDHDLHRHKTWDEVLTESYERFKGDFAPRGQL